jgi:hypothetical protein
MIGAMHRILEDYLFSESPSVNKKVFEACCEVEDCD